MPGSHDAGGREDLIGRPWRRAQAETRSMFATNSRCQASKCDGGDGKAILGTRSGSIGTVSSDLASQIRDSVELQNMTTVRLRTGVPTIRFDAMLHTIDKSTILRLPEKASSKLQSRGQVAVQGTINGHGFETVLEPDGYLGHWMRIDGKLQRTAALRAGDTVKLEIEPLKDWPEPNVPKDLETALGVAPQKIQELWRDITPMARWEWVRWVNATQNSDTRKRRVEVSISKMRSGKRRPCCFNLAACTDPDLSRSGRLIEPA